MRGSWCRISLRLGPGQYCLVRPPNPPQLIKEGFLGVPLIVFFFFFSIAPSGNFSADALEFYVSNTPKPNLIRYTCRITPKRVTSLLCPSPRHSAKVKQLPAYIDVEVVANCLAGLWNSRTLDLPHTRSNHLNVGFWQNYFVTRHL